MATLSTYITEVRRLLHDANGNFYTDSQLTDYINSSRERTVRDTGCLRTIQIVQTPAKVPSSSALNGVVPTNPVAWTASTPVALNDFIFSNIFIYQSNACWNNGYNSSAIPTKQLQQHYQLPTIHPIFKRYGWLNLCG